MFTPRIEQRIYLGRTTLEKEFGQRDLSELNKETGLAMDTLAFQKYVDTHSNVMPRRLRYMRNTSFIRPRDFDHTGSMKSSEEPLKKIV
jgi:hypothetical protein